VPVLLRAYKDTGRIILVGRINERSYCECAECLGNMTITDYR